MVASPGFVDVTLTKIQQFKVEKETQNFSSFQIYTNENVVRKFTALLETLLIGQYAKLHNYLD